MLAPYQTQKLEYSIPNTEDALVHSRSLLIIRFSPLALGSAQWPQAPAISGFCCCARVRLVTCI